MASKSTITKMQRIEATVKKYANKRAELKAKGDYDGLSKLPRDASPTRLRNLCQLTGRSRAYYRKFKLSRLMVRDLALSGLIPGMKKSSW
ncbi:MAG: 30S ribosomal protein S14 [Planctomycetaceae bacterium]|nr:30S ribosomal protein S14 [Planctomycetaceae bacterium]